MGDAVTAVTTKKLSVATVHPERTIGPDASSKCQKSRPRATAAAKSTRGRTMDSSFTLTSAKGTTIKAPRSSKRKRTATVTPSNAAPKAQAPSSIKSTQPSYTTTTSISDGVPAPAAPAGVNECADQSVPRCPDCDDASGGRAVGEAGVMPGPERAHYNDAGNGDGDGGAARSLSVQRGTNQGGGDGEAGSPSGGGDGTSRGPICGNTYRNDASGVGAGCPSGVDVEAATKTNHGDDGVEDLRSSSRGDAGAHPSAPSAADNAAASATATAAGAPVAATAAATAAPDVPELKWTEASLSYMFNIVKSDLANGRKPDHTAIVQQLGWHTHPAPARVKEKVQTKYRFMRRMVGCGVVGPYERFVVPAYGHTALKDKVREVLLACPGQQATVHEIWSALEGDPAVEPLLDRRAAITDGGRVARWEKQVSRILARPHRGFVNTGRKRKGRCVYTYDPTLDIGRAGWDTETANTQRQAAPGSVEPASQPTLAPAAAAAAAATKEGGIQERPRQQQQHPPGKEYADQQLPASPATAGPSSPPLAIEPPQASPLANRPRSGAPCIQSRHRTAADTRRSDVDTSSGPEPERISKRRGGAARKEARKEMKATEAQAGEELGAGSMHVVLDDPIAAAVAAALESLEQGLDVREEELELAVLQGLSGSRCPYALK